MNGWGECQLGDVVRLNYGWSLPKSKRLPGNIPVYGSNGVVGWHNRAFVESAGIIVGRKGSAGEVHLCEQPFCPIDTTFYIAPDDTSLDLVFSFYLLRHLKLSRIIGDVGVPGLNREAAYKEPVRFPREASQQRAIGLLLRALESLAAAQMAVVDRTTELTAAMLDELMTGRIRVHDLDLADL